MKRFSEETFSALEKAGWYDGRRVDTSEYERTVTQKGYPPSPILVCFLQEFGDLKLHSPTRDWKTMTFDAFETPLIVATFTRKLKRTFYHLGNLGGISSGLTMVMDSEGGVYVYYAYSSHDYGPNDLYLLGRTGEEAIERAFKEWSLLDESAWEWVANDEGESGLPLYV